MKDDFRISTRTCHIIEPPTMLGDIHDGAFKDGRRRFHRKYPVGTYGFCKDTCCPRWTPRRERAGMDVFFYASGTTP